MIVVGAHSVLEKTMDEQLKNSDSWQNYPKLKWVYNKLELSEKLGYLCGPSTVPVPKTGKYVERPIINLSNMLRAIRRYLLNFCI